METPLNRATPARLWSLDVFRGVCALMVFLTHWHLWSNFVPTGPVERFVHGFLSNGIHLLNAATWNTGGQYPAVIGFFVLSGFCIHASHCRSDPDPRNRPDWPAYFANRAKRIMPVYWWAALLGLGFVALQNWRPAAEPLLQFHATGTLSDYLLRLSALNGVYPREVLAGNSTLNTVASELAIYALYPVFLICARQEAWKTMGVIALLGQFAVLQLVQRFSPYWSYGSPAMMAIFWYAGAWAAKLHHTRPRRMPALAIAACWLAFLGARELPEFPYRNLLLQLLWGAVCLVVLLWLIAWEHRSPESGRHPLIRAARHAGTISYSLYATHTPVMLLISWALLQATTTTWLGYGSQLTFHLAGSLAVAYATYYVIERRYFIAKARQESAPA